MVFCVVLSKIQTLTRSVPFINVHYNHLKALVPVKSQRGGLSFLLPHFSFRAYNISLIWAELNLEMEGARICICAVGHICLQQNGLAQIIGKGVDIKGTVQTNCQQV